MGESFIGTEIGGDNHNKAIEVFKADSGLYTDEAGSLYTHIQSGTTHFFQKVEEGADSIIEAAESAVLNVEKQVGEILNIEVTDTPETGADTSGGEAGLDGPKAVEGHPPFNTLPVEGPNDETPAEDGAENTDEDDVTPEDGLN